MTIIEVKNRAEILNSLKFLKASFRLNSKKALKIICKITILNDKIQLAISGSFHELRCKTQGVA